jgi:hypothetical protein
MLGVQTTPDCSKQMERDVLLSQIKQASSFRERQPINTVLRLVSLNMNFFHAVLLARDAPRHWAPLTRHRSRIKRQQRHAPAHR